MGADGEGIVQEALQGLIHQFAEPTACLRELIQNAIDAGSTEIDVRFAREAGRLVIHVDDYGEGMDRRIIDTKLTRLFSSSKDDDRTKIGRFGIGFVSVFALDPEVVCVDTSRSGEHWRVIFKPDRSFTRVARPEPVDGTKIRIYVRKPAAELDALTERARAAVAFWCRHVAAEIRVDGAPINAPFDLDLPCKVAQEFGETRVVVGYARDEGSFAGYYNRGLTLLEESPGPLPRVHAKVWSPALEHTMTRDNVLRDAGFAKVMQRVRELARGELRARLFEVLAGSVPPLHRHGEPSEHLYAALAWLVEQEEALPRGALKRPIVRLLGGEAIDLASLKSAAKSGALWSAAADSAVTAALRARGDRVVAVAPGSAVRTLLRAATGAEVPAADAALCAAELVPAATRPPGWAPLQEALVALLAALAPARGVELATLSRAEPLQPVRAAIAQGEPGELTPTDEQGALGRRRWLVLNLEHAGIAEALALAPREPEFAAAAALKLFWLEGQALTTTRAAELAAAALELRCRRRKT